MVLNITVFIILRILFKSFGLKFLGEIFVPEFETYHFGLEPFFGMLKTLGWSWLSEPPDKPIFAQTKQTKK